MCNRSSHLRRFLPSPALISEQIAIKHQTLSFTTFSSSTVIQFLVPRFRSDHSAEWTKLEKRKPDYNFLHDCHITFSIFFFPPDLSRAINWREGAREMRNKMKKKLSSAGGPSGRACCAALKMSIIDPRKGNEIQRPNIKKSFSISFFCNSLPRRRCFLSLAIHHIQLPRLFNQKSPFSESRFGEHRKSARKAIVLTPSAASEKKAKKMPNHHLGCGYVDVWSRVMLLQFPSGRFFSFLSYFHFFFLSCSAWTFGCASCTQPFPPPLASQNFFTSWWSSLLLAFAPWSRG